MFYNAGFSNFLSLDNSNYFISLDLSTQILQCNYLQFININLKRLCFKKIDKKKIQKAHPK